MKIHNDKILIGTGGTGGHVFPSLSLAEYLSKEYNIEIIPKNSILILLLS